MATYAQQAGNKSPGLFTWVLCAVMFLGTVLNYLDRQVVQEILSRFYDRGVDCSLPLWTLLGLKVWFRSVFRAASACTGAVR